MSSFMIGMLAWRCRSTNGIRWALATLVGLGIGGALFFFFYYFSGTWDMLLANLASQRVANWGILSSFRSCFGSAYGVFVFGLLAFSGVTFVFLAVRTWRTRCVSLIPISALFGIVACTGAASVAMANPSRQHFAAVVPLLAYGLCLLAVNQSGAANRLLQRTAVVLLFVSTTLCFAYSIPRAVNAFSGGRHWIDQQKDALAKIPSSDRVYLPVDFWAAAADLKLKNVVIYTFPNVATPDFRKAYAAHAWKNAAEGDWFIPSMMPPALKKGYFKPEAASSFFGERALVMGKSQETIVVDYGVRSAVNQPWRKQGEIRYPLISIDNLKPVLQGELY